MLRAGSGAASRFGLQPRKGTVRRVLDDGMVSQLSANFNLEWLD